MWWPSFKSSGIKDLRVYQIFTGLLIIIGQLFVANVIQKAGLDFLYQPRFLHIPV